MPHTSPLRLSSLNSDHSTVESQPIYLPHELSPTSCDQLNKHLLPIKVSAHNFRTAVSLHDTIDNIIQLRSFETPDLLVVTELDPRVGSNLWQPFETAENPVIHLSFTPILQAFTIWPIPLHMGLLISSP